MSTEQLLRLTQERHIVLLDRGHRVSIWAPGVRVSRATRADIRTHTHEILSLIRQCSIWACPSPDLHRPYWYYRSQSYRCAACEQVSVSV